MENKKWKIEEKIIDHKKHYAIYKILDAKDDGSFIKDYYNMFLNLQDAINYIKKEEEKNMEKFTINYFKKEGVKVFDKVPESWTELTGALTAPKGYKWYSNNKSRFGGEYEHALIKDNNDDIMNELYFKIGENGELEKGVHKNKKINDGYMTLKTVLNTLPILINAFNKLCLKTQKILDDWATDKSHESYYKKEFDKLEKSEDQLYNTYYYMIHAILSNDEIDKIQKDINYNFMSFSFYSKTIDLFRNSNKLQELKGEN